jgi:hypothetical protein
MDYLVRGGDMTNDRWLDLLEFIARQRRQDLLGLVAGFWMFLSPDIMAYTHLPYASWSAYTIGGALVLAAIVSFIRRAPWVDMLKIALGLWLTVSPFALGFAAHGAVAMNAVLAGVTVIGFAFWGLLDDAKFREWWHDHMHHAG